MHECGCLSSDLVFIGHFSDDLVESNYDSLCWWSVAECVEGRCSKFSALEEKNTLFSSFLFSICIFVLTELAPRRDLGYHLLSVCCLVPKQNILSRKKYVKNLTKQNHTQRKPIRSNNTS